MFSPRSQQKIKFLLSTLSKPAVHEPAKKIIPKYYDLASAINEQMPAEKNQDLLTPRQKQRKQTLQTYLNQLQDSFKQFSSSKKNQIKQFNQVEYYMYEQTERIIHKYQPTFVDIVFHKLNQLKNLFIKPDATHDDHKPQIVDDTSSSVSDKKNNSDKKLELYSEHPQKQNAIQSNFSLRQLSPKQFSKSWEQIEFYYQNHRLDQAFMQLQRFQKYRQIHHKNQALTPQQQELAFTIKFQHKTMIQFYNHFYDTGYTFDKQQKGISLWYKIIGQKDVAIKVQAQVDISIQNFLCIASQINLFEDYIPFTYGTRQLKSISRNQKIGTSKVYIPLLTDRETYFYAAAYDCLRTKGSIFFFSKTINQDLQYQNKYGFKVPQNSQLVRLQYKYYILEYIPISKTRGKIRMVSSIDLKMDYLPMFIINKSARIFSFDYMRNYHRINKKFAGSKWDKIKQDKKQLYDYFQQKIDQYLQQKQHHNK